METFISGTGFARDFHRLSGQPAEGQRDYSPGGRAGCRR
nr:hypothetical protein [Pseudescherichia vulneris]